MPIKYKNIVPWGRSYEEYIRMFNLTEEDLKIKILSCGDGPASFNSGIYKNGHSMVSVDPIYQFSKEQIKERIDTTYKDVMHQTSNNKDKFIWTHFHSLEELLQARIFAMSEFLVDYDKGKAEGRYVFGELPELAFESNSFDLVLCAHFLFFYTDNLTLDFHYKSIAEMCRVGKEIRIFPIVDLNAKISLYLDPVKNYIVSLGWFFEEVKSGYEFQKNGNTFLRIFKNKN
jgi:hypothetical protein